MEINKANINSNIEFIDTNFYRDEKEAESSLGMNPSFRWAKIVVTDDKPNLNKQRIPIEEFANIIKTGIYTPIKMTFNKISSSHKEAIGQIIGTITQLTKNEDKIIALAAFWEKERPEDIKMLKEMYDAGYPPNVSWEIAFSDSFVDDAGVEVLKNTALTGLAIVSNPAYGGRTRFLAISSTEEEESTMDELEQLKKKIEELESIIEDYKSKEATTSAELEELRLYKDAVEKEKAEAERFDKIKNKFKEAGIEKDEEYFVSNKDKLLQLSEDAVEFMVQEILSFGSKETESSVKVKVPNFQLNKQEKIDPRELGKLMRENKK